MVGRLAGVGLVGVGPVGAAVGSLGAFRGSAARGLAALRRWFLWGLLGLGPLFQLPADVRDLGLERLDLLTLLERLADRSLHVGDRPLLAGQPVLAGGEVGRQLADETLEGGEDAAGSLELPASDPGVLEEHRSEVLVGAPLVVPRHHRRELDHLPVDLDWTHRHSERERAAVLSRTLDRPVQITVQDRLELLFGLLALVLLVPNDDLRFALKRLRQLRGILLPLGEPRLVGRDRRFQLRQLPVNRPDLVLV